MVWEPMSPWAREGPDAKRVELSLDLATSLKCAPFWGPYCQAALLI